MDATAIRAAIRDRIDPVLETLITRELIEQSARPPEVFGMQQQSGAQLAALTPALITALAGQQQQVPLQQPQSPLAALAPALITALAGQQQQVPLLSPLLSSLPTAPSPIIPASQFGEGRKETERKKKPEVPKEKEEGGMTAVQDTIRDRIDPVLEAMITRELIEQEASPSVAPGVQPSPGMRGTSKTFTRYTDISCPRRVWMGTKRFSVVVRLRRQPSQDSEATEPLLVTSDQPVSIHMDAPAFEVLGPVEQETAIKAEEDSPPVVFDLCPRQTGDFSLTFNFLQRGNLVGIASVMVGVTANEVSEMSVSQPGPLLRSGVDIEPPDFTLYITYERSLNPPKLFFELRTAP